MQSNQITPKDVFAANNVLTIDLAKKLLGKKIATTAPEYRMNKAHVTTFIVSGFISEFEYNLTQKCEGYSSRAAYWLEKLPNTKATADNTILILNEKGEWMYRAFINDQNHCFEMPTFHGSDEDRPVFYIEITG